MNVYLVFFYRPTETGMLTWRLDSAFYTEGQAQQYIDHHTPAWAEDSCISSLPVWGD